MNRILLAIAVICLSAASLVFAQGGPNAPDCHFCVKASADECKDTFDTQFRGCDSTVFTVPCSGTFRLCVRLVCPHDDCQNCRAIGNVWYGASNLASTSYGCTLGCVEPLNWCPEVVLQTGVQYVLTTCKIKCQEADCSNCNSQCRAVAYVYNDDSVCPAP